MEASEYLYPLSVVVLVKIVTHNISDYFRLT